VLISCYVEFDSSDSLIIKTKIVMKQYIDKSALVAEIERIKHETNYEPFTDEVFGKRYVCGSLLSFLDTLEVKEVDLEKEVITTEELRAEIKRRWLLEQEEKKKALRCRNCVHCVRHPSGWLKMYLCDARTWGKKIKRNYCVNLSDKACELFENKHKEE